MADINVTSFNDHVYINPVEKVFGIIYYSVILLIGVFGNLFIIVAANRVKKYTIDHKTLLIIKYLALIDFLGGVLLYPNFIYLTWVEHFPLPSFYCQILGLSEIYFPTTSTFLVLTMVAVKVDMIRNPFHTLSDSNVLVHVICVLVCCFGLIIPGAPFYGCATYIYCPKRMTCTFDFYPKVLRKKIFVTSATFFCCVAPLIAVCVLSFYMIKKIGGMGKPVQPTDGHFHKKKVNTHKSVKVILLVVLAYLVCWFAFFLVFTVAFVLGTEEDIPWSLLFWPKAMLMTNNAVNPVIYMYSNRNIQRYFVYHCLPRRVAQTTQLYQETERERQDKKQGTWARTRSMLVPMDNRVRITSDHRENVGIENMICSVRRFSTTTAAVWRGENIPNIPNIPENIPESIPETPETCRDVTFVNKVFL